MGIMNKLFASIPLPPNETCIDKEANIVLNIKIASLLAKMHALGFRADLNFGSVICYFFEGEKYVFLKMNGKRKLVGQQKPS